MIRQKSVIVIIIIMILSKTASAAPGRFEMSLSGDCWRLWLDREAEYWDDELFLPPVDLANIPSNPPTCGWDRLDNAAAKTVSVPGTVEEHYWGANGNPVGIAGDPRGVSWWSRTFTLESEFEGKRIVLAFDCVNLRAEVYVNRKLAGYDVVANTPFECDITDAVLFGTENRLDIRITDPVGNFSWPAHVTFPWGNYNIPAVRGFGGITGDITLRALDNVSVADIYVENSPKITEAAIHVALVNMTEAIISGELSVVIRDYRDSDVVLWEKTLKADVPAGEKTFTVEVKAPKAKVWDILKPNLYSAEVTFHAANISDSMSRRFGFRWFDIGEKDGDKRLYLNGRRVFIRGCKNRTFWPSNGIYASPEMAKKDVQLVIDMGYNAIKVTNAIAPPNHVRFCDELGVLYTGRSSGYRINGPGGAPIQDEFARASRRENLRRFIMRDRSSPALFFWSLKGEDGNAPDEDDYANMAMLRELDKTRIFVYNGGRDRTKKEPWINDPDSPAKSFYKPLDDTIHTHGWWDMHHWGHAGYRDIYYRNPKNFLRLNIVDGDSTRHVLPDEVLYYGEEGSFGNMVQLDRIRQEIVKRDEPNGWRERELLDWYGNYERFLDEADFRSAFPTVDHLTQALGENLFYFHARVLENCRVSNIIDAYIINGAASAATHTDMFDIYRNPVSDTSILRYYSQPLYIAVKLRDKVMPAGTAPVADIFIVNEENLKSRQTLCLDFISPSGETVFSERHKVSIFGGEEYGQLLLEGVRLPVVTEHGYYTLKACIEGKGGPICSGYDDLFSVDYRSGGPLSGRGAVIDDSGKINALLSEARGVTLPDFVEDRSRYDYILVGEHDFEKMGRARYRAIMEQVYNGAALVVIDNVEAWAEQWDDVYWYQAIQYRGSRRLNNRGRLFVGKSPLLDGLPNAEAMGWEYQIFYGGQVRGLDIGRLGNETVVGLAAEHRGEILTSVTRIPFGNGVIIASTLDMLRHLDSDEPQSAAAKKLFLNFVEKASTGRAY